MLRSLLLASLVYGTSLASHVGPDAAKELATPEGLEALVGGLGPDLTELGSALGERLHTLTVTTPGLDRAALAAETLTTVSPLVERLGLDSCRARLDDASFAILSPAAHAALAEGADDRHALGVRLQDQASSLLDELQLSGDLSWRSKSLYSTWRKMQRKGLRADQVMDRVALRVVLDDEAACREVLAALHERYEPVDGEFDDYIAQPKPNGYQSLHTVVRVDGEVAEVQLRTHAMHAHAERGAAAHWRYKLAA